MVIVMRVVTIIVAVAVIGVLVGILARAQLGAAFARAGDAERAERAFAAALAAPGRNDWLYDYGSAARDALAVLVLAREAQMPPAMLATARERLPGPEFTSQLASTQEMGWAVLAAASLGQDQRPMRALLDRAPLAARRIELTGPVLLRNAGEAPLPVQVSVTGTPADRKFIEIPPPIVPAPITPTRLMSRALVSSDRPSILLAFLSAKKKYCCARAWVPVISSMNRRRSSWTPSA